MHKLPLIFACNNVYLSLKNDLLVSYSEKNTERPKILDPHASFKPATSSGSILVFHSVVAVPTHPPAVLTVTLANLKGRRT